MSSSRRIESAFRLFFRGNNVRSAAEAIAPSSRSIDTLNLLELNALAVLRYYDLQFSSALQLQQVAVELATKTSLGRTHDSYVDLCGNLNDLAMLFLVNNSNNHTYSYSSSGASSGTAGVTDVCKRYLKRSIYSADRSYKRDSFLLAVLHNSLSDVSRIAKESRESLGAADKTIELLSLSTGKVRAVDANKDAMYYHSNDLLELATRSRLLVNTGKTISMMRNYEEGIIYMNQGVLLGEEVASLVGAAPLPIFQLDNLLDVALVHMSSLRVRGKVVSCKHIQRNRSDYLDAEPYDILSEARKRSGSGAMYFGSNAVNNLLLDKYLELHDSSCSESARADEGSILAHVKFHLVNPVMGAALQDVKSLES